LDQSDSAKLHRQQKGTVTEKHGTNYGSKKHLGCIRLKTWEKEKKLYMLQGFVKG